MPDVTWEAEHSWQPASIVAAGIHLTNATAGHLLAQRANADSAMLELLCRGALIPEGASAVETVLPARTSAGVIVKMRDGRVIGVQLHATSLPAWAHPERRVTSVWTYQPYAGRSSLGDQALWFAKAALECRFLSPSGGVTPSTPDALALATAATIGLLVPTEQPNGGPCFNFYGMTGLGGGPWVFLSRREAASDQRRARFGAALTEYRFVSTGMAFPSMHAGVDRISRRIFEIVHSPHRYATTARPTLPTVTPASAFLAHPGPVGLARLLDGIFRYWKHGNVYAPRFDDAEYAVSRLPALEGIITRLQTYVARHGVAPSTG